MKRLFLQLRGVTLFVMGFFFDKKYLQGRFFEGKLVGFRWCFRALFQRNILRLAPPLPFPAAISCTLGNPENIHFDPNDLNNFQSPGTYFQCAFAKIYLGKGTYIAPNVGIITSNHSLTNLNEHLEGKDVRIGDGCWLGMNSVILPGVKLGKGTVVAAGSVVTKSFPEGNVVIGGVPAKVIKIIG